MKIGKETKYVVQVPAYGGLIRPHCKCPCKHKALKQLGFMKPIEWHLKDHHFRVRITKPNLEIAFPLLRFIGTWNFEDGIVEMEIIERRKNETA